VSTITKDDGPGNAIHYLIDKRAVLMARQIVAREAARQFANFYTSIDISHVIYPEFRENPFRFLSLYDRFNLFIPSS